ncbi:regulator [Streptomyces sp. NPDC092952]|uniref:regulator n=1 Tax=Streptomyces sp. NPDC092952 TaxID=3366018 RepID=UPI0038194FF4
MKIPFTATEARRTVELLASRPLVRLVTEIDDNGAIPPRRLAGTLPDLSAHQLRSAVDTARAHSLVRIAPGTGLELTETGEELADLYDAMARWARRRALPATVCDFNSRIQCVLDLLAPSLTTEHTNSSDEDLGRIRTLLIQWLANTPRTAEVFEPELAA